LWKRRRGPASGLGTSGGRVDRSAALAGNQHESWI